MGCSCQCSTDLSFCTEHTSRDSPPSSPASLGQLFSFFSLYQHSWHHWKYSVFPEKFCKCSFSQESRIAKNFIRFLLFLSTNTLVQLPSVPSSVTLWEFILEARYWPAFPHSKFFRGERSFPCWSPRTCRSVLLLTTLEADTSQGWLLPFFSVQ